MTFFSWFGKKAVPPDSEPPINSGLSQVDITLPMYGVHPQTSSNAEASSRSERLERREMLYVVVRECMTAAGFLSSTYKFKVLSLDSSGQKYLIMMDIPREPLSDGKRFAEIEGSIARGAKERFNILVTAMYWRVNELVTAKQWPESPTKRREHAKSASVLSAASAPVQTQTSLEQELQAFKMASADGTLAERQSDQSGKSWHRPQATPDFSNTEPFDVASNLGPSQFGGLI